jgi:hypothetical protein
MPVQVISDTDGSILALFVTKTADFPKGHNFLTQSSDELQFAVFKHPIGHSIQRHWHPNFSRNLDSTSEVLVIQSGKVEASIYSKSFDLIHKQLLGSDDVVVLLSGGHGFEILEDAVILEVKQGPYAGSEDKKVF